MGDEQKLEKKLSTISVWALAFGCIIGWGAFVMPGETCGTAWDFDWHDTGNCCYESDFD